MARNGSRARKSSAGPRNAGILFMCASLGLLAGLAWRVFFQPTRYHAEAGVSVFLTPRDAPVSVDWTGKARRWRDLPRARETRELLQANLRRAIKTAAVPLPEDGHGELSRRLAGMEQPLEFSASLFRGSLSSRLGPSVTVGRQDLAANLDYQSLAAIIADLDPPGDQAGNWDFSFFQPMVEGQDRIIVQPGPDDAYFRVFHHLHRILNNGRPALSPVAAWRSAVAELNERLDREARFAGGGGFGSIARAELIRELDAIPVLAANGLYHAVGMGEGMADDGTREMAEVWRRRWEEGTDLEVRVDGPGVATVTASMEMTLHPVAFPRDTVLTRVPPQALATLLTFLAGWEDRNGVGERPVRTPKLPPAPEETPDGPPADTEADASGNGQAEAPEAVQLREVIDDALVRERDENIACAEQALTQSRLQYGSAMLRLDGERNAVDRMSREALAGRARVDRLRERRENLDVLEGTVVEELPPAKVQALAARDAVAARLARLLETCTEEHPFVRAARRELAAAETLVLSFPANEIRNAQARRMREAARAERALAEAGAELDRILELLQIHERNVDLLIQEAEGCSRVIAERERELAVFRAMPISRVAIVTAEPPDDIPDPAEVPDKPPAETPAAEEEIPAPAPRLLFEDAPAHIALRRLPPAPLAPLWGMLGGMALGLGWLVFRNVLGSRFYTPLEAERMVGLPVLAALPAYETRSIRTAAEGMGGRLCRSRGGRLQFIPAMIDTAEPPPAARRGTIVPARVRPGLLAPLLGLAFLVLAGLLYYRSLEGFARPRAGFRGDLPQRVFRLPVETGAGRDGTRKDAP